MGQGDVDCGQEGSQNVANVPEEEQGGLGDVRRIPGAHDYYATRDGKILSSKSGSMREKRQMRHPNGYMIVSLRVGGKDKTFTVHRLVLLTFAGAQPSPAHEARHLDGNRLNNAAANLAWGTHQENIDDKRRHGTLLKGDRHPMRINPMLAARGEKQSAAIRAGWARDPSRHASGPAYGAAISRGKARGFTPRGESHPCSRLTWEQVCRIREEKARGASDTELSAAFGVSRANIYYIYKGTNWKNRA